MKTLDEVIEILERQTDKTRIKILDKDLLDSVPDALHYLKAYRENQIAYEDGNRKAEEARERYIEAVKNCEQAENKYRRLIIDGTSQKFVCPKCHSEFIVLPEPNPALTWDELKQMEGKPVWVEGKTMEENYKFWCIVGKTDKLDTYIHLHEHGYNNWKNTYGEWWQAYRKERADAIPDNPAPLSERLIDVLREVRGEKNEK